MAPRPALWQVSLQQLVARELSPTDAGVVSVSRFNTGAAPPVHYGRGGGEGIGYLPRQGRTKRAAALYMPPSEI